MTGTWWALKYYLLSKLRNFSRQQFQADLSAITWPLFHPFPRIPLPSGNLGSPRPALEA